MKKILFLVAAGLALTLASAPRASGRVVVGATVGIPAISGYYSPSYAPGYYSPRYFPTPSYHYGYSYCPPPPVVVYPPPIVTYRPRAYVGAPVVSFGFNFNGGHYRHGYGYSHRYGAYRGCW